MKIVSIAASTLTIPFVRSFRHASATRSETETIWVEANSAHRVGMGEGCPRVYVTRETIATASDFVATHTDAWLQSIDSVDALRHWATRNRVLIDDNPAAWCAVELALLDLIGKGSKQSVETLLGVPSICGTFEYSAVVSDGSQGDFDTQLRRYLGAGFRHFKVKLSGEMAKDLGKVVSLRHAGIAPERVRFDANNLWCEAGVAIQYLADLSFPFAAIEEPLSVGDFDGMRQIAAALGVRIILDESFVRAAQLDVLADDAERWIVNVRVSKMGGLCRSIEIIERAKQLGLSIIVGAHVGETSVLTRAGLTVATAARSKLHAIEGAAGTHLLQRDVVDLAVMFGVGGRIEGQTIPNDQSGGLNLRIDPVRLRSRQLRSDPN